MTRARALGAVHAAVLLFGFAGLFGRWLDLSPVAIVLGRSAIAACALAVVRWQVGRDRLPFDLRLVANGAVLALHWIAFFAAIQAAGVAIGLLGFSSFPLFVLILERAMLGRRWSAAEAPTRPRYPQSNAGISGDAPTSPPAGRWQPRWRPQC